MSRSEIEFINEKVIETEADTLLSASLEAGIPHLHICGGNARCSTCRVKVERGNEELQPRNKAEQKLAEKKGWPEDIRLACQVEPIDGMAVKRLVLDEEDALLAQVEKSDFKSGIEKEIAVLFVDVADFTPFTEKNLPYDVVHIMNRLFTKLGQSIYDYNGFIDKYIGDNIMALFGIKEDETVKEAALNAAAAAHDMTLQVTEFNRYLKDNFNHVMKIRIGVASGSAILGSFGHRKKLQYTALGDTVNTAARIEGANKKAGTVFLAAEEIIRYAEGRIQTGRKFRARLKGKSEQKILYEVLSVEHLKPGKENEKTAGSPAPKPAVNLKPAADFRANTEIDYDHSAIDFNIRFLMTKVRGRFEKYRVDLKFDPENIESSELSVAVDMASVHTFNNGRDEHLRSEEILDVARYPEMTFKSREIRAGGDKKWFIEGDLTIKGITLPVMLEIKDHGVKDDMMQNTKYGFTAHTVIDRTDFNVDYNMPLVDDSIAIGRTVEIEIVLQFSLSG